MGFEGLPPMGKAMTDMAEDENRAEQAFWQRLSKSGPEAVESVKKLSGLTDNTEKSKLVEEFNRGRELKGPFTKDGIDLDDGSRIKVYRDQEGTINLGWSSSL